MEYICRGCGNVLTEYDRLYYSHTCEACERELMDRIDVWRYGGEDPELDKTFTPKPPTHQ